VAVPQVCKVNAENYRRRTGRLVGGEAIWKTFGLLIAGTHAVIQTLKKWRGK
jgi:hypothetical protein